MLYYNYNTEPRVETSRFRGLCSANLFLDGVENLETTGYSLFIHTDHSLN